MKESLRARLRFAEHPGKLGPSLIDVMHSVMLGKFHLAWRRANREPWTLFEARECSERRREFANLSLALRAVTSRGN